MGIANYWGGLTLLPTDGRVVMDNNPVDRTIRPISPIVSPLPRWAYRSAAFEVELAKLVAFYHGSQIFGDGLDLAFLSAINARGTV